MAVGRISAFADFVGPTGLESVLGTIDGRMAVGRIAVGRISAFADFVGPTGLGGISELSSRAYEKDEVRTSYDSTPAEMNNL